MFPKGLKYSQSHEWVKVDNGKAVIGITDYAVSQLGDIVFVELPELNKEVKQNDSFGVVESVKAVSDIISPLSGKVTAVNDNLSSNPEIIAKEPYGSGWIVEIELANQDELDALMDTSGYEVFVNEEQ